MDVGLLILRVVLGLIFVGHGTQKLFGWFGGYGLRGTAGFLESLRFRAPSLMATVLGTTETTGGILLAAGFVTPFAAAALAGTMLVAIATVHWAKGFWNTGGGYEFNLMNAAAAVSLAFTGPGAYSVDRALDWTLSGNEWGIGAVALGVVGALVTLATRRRPAPAAVSNEARAAAA